MFSFSKFLGSAFLEISKVFFFQFHIVLHMKTFFGFSEVQVFVSWLFSSVVQVEVFDNFSQVPVTQPFATNFSMNASFGK